MSRKPSYYAYVVTEGKEDEQTYWIRVGAAFPNADGKGFNIVLDALPPDGRLILREPNTHARPS